MSKYIEISTFTRKCLRWRPFTYSRWYEGLHLYEKMSSPQMISTETFEVLKKKILKKTAGGLLLISRDILNVLLVLSAKNQLIV